MACRLPSDRFDNLECTFDTSALVADSDGALVQGLCGVEDANAGRGSYQVKGLCLSLKQFFALLIKRLHHTTRSYKDFFAQVMFAVEPNSHFSPIQNICPPLCVRHIDTVVCFFMTK